MKKTLLCVIVVAALVLSVMPLLAADINFMTLINQDDFKKLNKEAGVALGYRNMAPAASLGVSGFDIGAEMTAISIDKESSRWNKAFNDDAPSYLVIPKIRARKGLPLGIDIGAMYSYVPNSNIKVYGAELSKSILEGNMTIPAVSARATYTKLGGVKDMGLQTYGIDASISKGFVMITPYAGAGMIWINSEPKRILQSLATENIAIPRFFGGLKISPFPLFGITVEAEYAVKPIYSLKTAINF